MKTYYAKPGEIEREWLLVDASGKTLGRLATQLANILRGKNKPSYTPHVDTGDFVIVINAQKVKITGNKLNDKVYFRYTGYPGGIKAETLVEAFAKHPERVIEHAVKGMLPKNAQGARMARKLKVYAQAEHPHMAQKPRKIELEA